MELEGSAEPAWTAESQVLVLGFLDTTQASPSVSIQAFDLQSYSIPSRVIKKPIIVKH